MEAIVGRYFADPDYSLAFYHAAFATANREVDNGNPVLVVTFPTIKLLKSWCETGNLGKARITMMCAPLRAAIQATTGAHKQTLQTHGHHSGSLSILIEVKYDAEDCARCFSCLVLRKVTDKSMFDSAKQRLPLHFAGLEVIAQRVGVP